MSATYTAPPRPEPGRLGYSLYDDILPLDILAIWGLLWYGGRRRAFREAQRGTAG